MGSEDKFLKAQEDRISRETDYFKRKYKTHFASLDKSPLARARSLTEWDYYALGKQLSAYEMYQSINEADGSVTALGALPKIALDAISIGYGASPINVIAGVQPLEEVQGLVFFRDFVAQTTRGNVTSGDTLLSSTALPDTFPSGGFTGSASSLENIVHVPGGGTATFTAVALGGGGAFMSPINLQLTNLVATVVFSAGTANFPTMTPDVTTGYFSSAVTVASTLYVITGTVHAATGTVDVAFNATPSGATDVYINYQTVEEANTDLQKAILKLRNITVTSEDWALKSTVGIFEAYQLKKRFGIVAEEQMALDLTAVVNNEIMNRAVGMIAATVPSGNAVTWLRQAQTGTSTFEHQLTLKNALNDAEANLMLSAGRGTVNVMLAGLNACAVMKMLPGFKLLYDSMDFGSHIYGTLDGVTIVRVPYASVLDTNTIIGLYKGKNPYDTSLIWAPYMPLFVTNTLPMAYNPLQQQRAVAVSGALASVVPNLSTKTVIDQSGYNYA